MSQKIFSKNKAIVTGLFLFGMILVNGINAQNVFTVTKVTDTDPFGYDNDSAACDPDMYGTLQWAFRKVNDAIGASVIDFNISGGGPHVITLNYELPTIIHEVTIDGTSQYGYQWHHPEIIIDGINSNSSTGIAFYNDTNCLVKGLHIKNFKVYGIILSFCEYISIQDNIITEISNLNENAGTGIRLDPSRYCTIYGNLIGTDANNTNLGNHPYGIMINGASGNTDDNIIGGVGKKQNTIAYSGIWGVRILYCKHELITRNLIFNNAQKAIILQQSGNENKSKPIFDPITDLSNVTGTSEPGDSVELFGSTGAQNANEYLGTVITNVNGHWNANLSGSTWSHISATATDADNNTSELAISNEINDSSFCHCEHLRFCFPEIICAGEAVTVINGSVGCPENTEFTLDYGDNTPSTDSMTHIFTNPGDYIVKLSIATGEGCRPQFVSSEIHITDCSQPCINCISSFAPEPGKKYIISAWVKENNSPVTKTSYDKPQIFIDFLNQDSSIISVGGPYTAKGNIIDGWQKVEEEFEIPETTVLIKIEMKSDSGSSYFDDIRVFPFDATVKSYVYDPINLRLVSELDERNYATFYEYDEEGKLVRVKKETERGVMTIKESKNSISKE